MATKQGKRPRVICDSSALISLSMNCMLPIIAEFSESVDFIIPRGVYQEIVLKPRGTLKYKLSSLKFGQMVKNGVMQVEEADADLARRIMNAANTIFRVKHHAINIVQEGETEVLALAQRGDTILMDERTMRYLIEKPEMMADLLQRRMQKNIRVDRERLERFKMFTNVVTVLRSSELIARAYEKGMLERYFGDGKDALEAALWALKFAGCSLTDEEINEYLRISR